jgi:hypothetical protein
VEHTIEGTCVDWYQRQTKADQVYLSLSLSLSLSLFLSLSLSPELKPFSLPLVVIVDTLGIEPRASRMLGGCDTTTPCAHTDILTTHHHSGTFYSV